MAKRATKRLDAATVRGNLAAGRHADGEGLYLVVDPSGARRWMFMFRWRGKLKEMGLGGLSTANGLARAREKAEDARRLVADGKNPIEARRSAQEVPTFGAVADEVIAVVEKNSRNAKHVAQWRMTLTEYAAPIRDKLVSEITTDDVLGVLKPLSDRPETASRLRGRIERVLDAAKAKKHRTGENPATWRGHLSHLLPKRQKLTRGHHTAMPFADAPAFVARLREREAMAALALEFVILTAARTGEVIGARWSEIDLEGKVWTVPAERMKAAREHRVPLSARAVAILEKAAESRRGAYVFPGPGKDRTLSTNALRALLQRMGDEVTAHGFRSSFRDWAGEASTFPRELAEAALAHTVGDATERAYRRGDALEKRRRMMDAWAAFCAPKSDGSTVVPLVKKDRAT